MQAAERLRTLARSEPWIVLAPLVVAQWVVLAVFAFTVQRNGWLFYQGGDQTWFYTSAWELAHGRIRRVRHGHDERRNRGDVRAASTFVGPP